MTTEELKRQSAAIDEEGLGGTSDRMKRMMEYWKVNRPKMYQRHQEQGTLVNLAQVLEMRYIRLVKQAISRGMPEDDASREYAEELLLMPENEDFQEENQQNDQPEISQRIGLGRTTT